MTLVLALIPLGSGQSTETEIDVDPVAAYLAASATVSDISKFCERNPQACETGGAALSAIGAQARDGARIVYEFLDAKVSKKDGITIELPREQQLAEAGEDGILVTGATTTQVTSGTLTHDDLALPWRGAAETPQQPNSAPQTASKAEYGPVPRPKPRTGGNA
ncbi:hypothetical protein JM93_00831 [Roseibium hamelinense]|uniref:DUF5330 domain-containing protein n=2 Tax=Roseibium hamelinense TaxID=150831 RepID=A0A562TJL8_9HYPH|nr:hypothetical protein JM93_00831 [Roseibium hamelinense]